MKIKNGLSSIIVLLVLWLVMPAMAQMAGLGSKLPSPMMTAALDGSPRLDARGAYISF